MKTLGKLKKQPRIDAIDLLRGLFIVIMIIDHVARFPNGLDYFSGRNALWFSAAEGFVALSGILVGYIYMPKFVINAKYIFRKLFQRAAILYTCVIVASLFFIGYSYFMFNATDFNHFTSIWDLLIQLMTLCYSFGWAEFLTHYVIFLILAPFVLYAFSRGYTWIVLLISTLVWICGLGLSEGQSRYEFTMSWQLLFIYGMFIGSHLTEIRKWFSNSFSEKNIKIMTISLWGGAALLYITSVVLAYGSDDIGRNITGLATIANSLSNVWSPINESWFSWWTDKATLAPLRIFFGLIIFWSLFTFFDRYHTKIEKYSCNILTVFGKKPLISYIAGAVIIFIIEKYIPQPDEENRHFIANLIVTISALVFTFIITKNSSKISYLVKSLFQRK